MENNENSIKEKLSVEDIKILKDAIWLTKRIIYLVGFLFLILLFLTPYVLTGVNSYVIVSGVTILIAAIILMIKALLGRMQKDIKEL